MDELHMLKGLHPIWLHRVAQSMVKAASVREDLRGQLDQFYSLLEQAVETGDPACLDPIISAWAELPTQSDLEGATSSLTEFLNELIQRTFNICRETLDENQTVEVIGTILPAWTFTYQRAAKYKIIAQMGYISNQLKETQQALERLNKGKSNFIAVAAHELKTPLTLIDGYASMLCESHEKVNPQSSEMHLLNGVRNGTVKPRSIVDDMIETSMIDNIWKNKIQGGKSRIRPSYCQWHRRIAWRSHLGGIARIRRKNLPRSTFHVLFPLRVDSPDQKMAELYEPLIQNRPSKSRGRLKEISIVY